MNRTILSVVGSLCRHFLPEGAIHSAKGEILQNSLTAYIYILINIEHNAPSRGNVCISL